MDIANHESIPVTLLKDAKVDSEKFREIIFTYSRFYNPLPSSSSSPAPTLGKLGRVFISLTSGIRLQSRSNPIKTFAE